MSNIEYRPGIKVGQVIDLTDPFEKKKLPKPETYLPALRVKLADLAKRQNAEYGYFINEIGQLIMDGPELAKDQGVVDSKQEEWALEFGKSVDVLLSDREKNPSNITEIATTLLFDKILSPEFTIVRASAYDDYENGADQLIIDNKTGAVICGLDDVIGNIGDDGGEKKEQKIASKMKRGGAEIKYGATIEAGKLQRKSLRNIPLFYFSLSKKELNDLLKSLTENEGGPTAPEIEIYTKLFNSLVSQAAEYTADKNLYFRLQENLQRFQPSLDKMRSYL